MQTYVFPKFKLHHKCHLFKVQSVQHLFRIDFKSFKHLQTINKLRFNFQSVPDNN